MDHLELSELLSRVSEKSDLYGVILKHTDLRRKGKVYVGSCPFHDDDKESLTVNTEEKKFYCSSCHAGGSVFKFIAMAEGCTLREAVKRQAKNVGVSLFEEKKTFDIEKIERKRRELTEVNEYAQDFYHDILIERQTGDTCRKYLEKRGISKVAVKKFKVGFAPVSDKNITIFLDSYGFSNELVLNSGLVTLEENLLVDKLQDCIVIPIKAEGKISGFVGEILNFDKKVFYETDGISARYIFTNDNQIFDKRRLIFGFEEARAAVTKSMRAVIVDDPLTAILLDSAGIEGVVAVLENKLTVYHVEILTQYAENIIFCLQDGVPLKIDNDTLKAVDYENAKISVAVFPKALSDFIREEGTEQFLRQLEKVQPCTRYKNFVKIESETIIENDLDNASDKIKRMSLEFDTPSKRWAEEVVLRVCSYNYQIVEYVINVLISDTFSRLHKDIFQYLKICYDEDRIPDEDGAKKFLHEAAYNELIRILTENEYRHEQDEKAFDAAVNILKNKSLSVEYSQVKKEILENNETSDVNLKKLNQLYDKRQAI